MAAPFQTLPSKDEYPDYYQMIAEPISYTEIRATAGKGGFATSLDLARSLFRMSANCQQYNHPGSLIAQDASRLRRLAKRTIKAYFARVSSKESPIAAASAAASASAGPSSKKTKSNDMIVIGSGGYNSASHTNSSASNSGGAARTSEPIGTATLVKEAEELQMTLHELVAAGCVPAGAIVACGRFTGDLYATSGTFLCRATRRPFPTPEAMREIASRGGFSSNGWLPLTVGGQTVPQLRAKRVAMLAEAAAASAVAAAAAEAAAATAALLVDDTIRLWQSEDEHLEWLCKQKAAWMAQRYARRLSLPIPRLPPSVAPVRSLQGPVLSAAHGGGGGSGDGSAVLGVSDSLHGDGSHVGAEDAGLLAAQSVAARAWSLPALPGAPLDCVTERVGVPVFFTDEYTAVEEACFACASSLDNSAVDQFVYVALLLLSLGLIFLSWLVDCRTAR